MLVPIPPARVVGPDRAALFCEVPDARAFLSACEQARSTRRTAQVAIVDPFSRRVSLHTVELFETRVDERVGFFKWRIHIHCTEDVQAQLLYGPLDGTPALQVPDSQGPVTFGTKPLAEDLATGEYIACVRQTFDAAVPKEPGFRVHGSYVFVGRALLVRGREIVCRTPSGTHGHLLDYWEDFTEADLESLALEFLSVAEARRARAEHRRSVAAMVPQIAQDAPLLCCIPASPSERLATCWGCASRGTARHKCSGCKQAYYCSAECQRAHWAEHKALCRSRSARTGEE